MLTLLTVTTPDEPITLAEAKRAARLDTAASELDAVVSDLITAAREQAEHLTGRQYRDVVMRATAVDWPAACRPALRIHAPRSVAISYWAGSAWQNLAGSAFAWAAADEGGLRVAAALGASWPALGQVAIGPRVRIDVATGPATPADVDQSVKLFIRAQVAAWIDSPGAISAGRLEVNPLFARLLDGHLFWA